MDVAAIVIVIVDVGAVTGVIVGLSGVVFVVAFNFESIKCTDGIIVSLQGPLCVFLLHVQQL